MWPECGRADLTALKSGIDGWNMDTLTWEHRGPLQNPNAIKPGIRPERMEMPAAFAEVINAFEALPDRRSKLEYLIELGEALECDDSIAVPENRIEGCVSTVYLSGTMVEGMIRFTGWADSLIVRGFVKVLCDALSDMPPATIVHESESVVDEFVKRTGINFSMVESRANTFGNLFARMRRIAEVSV